jgi:nucleoside-diphosphate-sugar epimerase
MRFLVSPRDDHRTLVVTGANGFLGSEICRQALNARLQVRGSDKNTEAITERLEYVPAVVLNHASLLAIMKNVGVIIHAAGLAHLFGNTQISRARFRDVNEIGTGNVAKVAAQAGAKHFILISSVSVYGGSRDGGHEDSGCYPNDPYAESKYGAELAAIEIAKASGMALTILRMATVYGEGDPGNLSRLMRSIDRRRFIWVGHGVNKKSLIHKVDAAHACLTVAQRQSSGLQVYNVSAPPCPMRDVVNNLADVLRRPVWPLHIPGFMALGFCELSVRLMPDRMKHLRAMITKWLSEDVYDSSKFEKTYGFSTRVKLREGLTRQVAWYKVCRKA